MRTIPLSRGYVALVDDDDYERVSAHKWHARPSVRKDGSVRTVYAYTSIWNGVGQNKIALHRFVMGALSGTYVDHADNDGINCQKSNLRIVTGTQNQGNRRRRIDSTSPYKGVTWRSDHKKWSPSIKVHGRNKNLGYFSDPVEAAKAYDAAARSYFGRYAHVNFPEVKI